MPTSIETCRRYHLPTVEHLRSVSGLERADAPYLCIGIIAWNEEQAIGSTISSLFRQSVFQKLRERGQTCHVLCVANGCTDNTAGVAARSFAEQLLESERTSGASANVEADVVTLAERGKVNAWNEYVHRLSDPGAQFLFMMDADILIHQPNTVWNMLRALEGDPEASVAVDRPCKHLEFKERINFWERISLRASSLTQSAEGQLCGQLYGLRASIARQIYIPRGLSACEDGFIKTMVCTDFLTRPVNSYRIRLAEDAEHTFEAYTSPVALLRNQKRQIIGQTMIHVLVDKHLARLPTASRLKLAETIRTKETQDAAWLKRLISEHLREVRWFWRLYPGLLGHRFRTLSGLRLSGRLACLPAALLATGCSLAASYLAYRLLRKGCMEYWPKAERAGLDYETSAKPAPAMANPGS